MLAMGFFACVPFVSADATRYPLRLRFGARLLLSAAVELPERRGFRRWRLRGFALERELLQKAEMAADGAHDLHLRFAEKARLEGGRNFDDAAAVALGLDEHLGHAEETRVRKLEVEHRALSVHPAAAREGVDSI